MNIKNEIQRATKLITIFSIPILMVLLLFRKQLLQLFGPEFVEGEVVLVTFSLSLLFNAMSGSVGLVLNMTSYQKAFRNMTIFCAALNGLLNYFLIREYGITGAAYASTIASIILNIIGVLYVKRKFGFYTFKWQ
jgi:O-antigen/teichoic acid export membrane protein